MSDLGRRISIDRLTMCDEFGRAWKEMAVADFKQVSPSMPQWFEGSYLDTLSTS